MESLKTIVENSHTRAGRVFDLSIQACIVLSMAAFALQTVPSLSPEFQFVLDVFECLTIAVFTGEYLLRLSVARNKWKFVSSFFGIVDLLAILPFYLMIGIDGRSIRAFRLLKLFRVLKLARYSQAIQRYHQALLISKEEIIIFFAATGIVLFISAVGIYHFEHDAQPEVFTSVFHSLWWAVVTLTSVGYGDTYPITTGGRLFTFGVLMVGLGVVSVPSGLIAAALTKVRRDLDHETQVKLDSQYQGISSVPYTKLQLGHSGSRSDPTAQLKQMEQLRWSAHCAEMMIEPTSDECTLYNAEIAFCQST